MPARVTTVKVNRYLTDERGAVMGQVTAIAEVGDGTPEQAREEALRIAYPGFLSLTRQDQPTPQPQDKRASGQASSNQPAAAVEFTDTETGEVFDVTDGERLKAAMGLLFRRRKFTKETSGNLTQYVLNVAKVHGFGAMPPANRLAFLKKLASGGYDNFNKKA